MYFKIALKSDHFILKIKKLNTQKLSIYLQKSWIVGQHANDEYSLL